MIKISSSFPRYLEHEPKVPVYILTPNKGAYLHRFFDTSPISPSGRYAAFLRLPYEDKLPRPGDAAEVVLIDLGLGPDSEKVIAITHAWEHQMGANINWGADDTTLCFNDLIPGEWLPFGIKMDPVHGTKNHFEHGIYHLSPDGKYAACSNLVKMRRTQYGYGAVVPDKLVKQNAPMPADEGLYITNVETGEGRLVCSIRDAHTRASVPSDVSDYDQGCHYGFHAKWSPLGNRLIWTTRWIPCSDLAWNSIRSRDMKFNVFTLRPDGSEIHNAVPARYWTRGGHHINWFPDGEYLSMNLGYFADRHKLDLVKVKYDGSCIGRITDAVPGSGHPSVHPDGRHILTDCYAQEFGNKSDSTPLRWIDYRAGREEEILRFPSRTTYQREHAVLRLDPHPAWTRDWQYVVFNTCISGSRRVCLADMRPLLETWV